MEERKNSGWKFWLGLALGAAAGYYLNSEEGRRLRQEYMGRAGRWSRELNDRALTELEHLSGKASNALQRSKDVADRTRTNLKQKINRLSTAAESAVDRTEESYERVADWAVDKLGNGSHEEKRPLKDGADA